MRDYDIIMSPDGGRVEAMLTDEHFIVRRDTIHGRLAVRAYAYSIGAEDPATCKLLLGKVGKEG